MEKIEELLVESVNQTNEKEMALYDVAAEITRLRRKFVKLEQGLEFKKNKLLMDNVKELKKEGITNDKLRKAWLDDHEDLQGDYSMIDREQGKIAEQEEAKALLYVEKKNWERIWKTNMVIAEMGK
jgi:hypothetical protein